MLFRSVNTAVLHNYNIILKEYLGVNIAAPIVGVTGTEWFAEGYFDGDYETFGHSKQEYDYDGIDGWDAMKREILYCKAMGFYTVSVFHLNSYGNKSVVEGYGFLDYYGLENIEELANEWHKPKTIEYPISCLKFELRRAGFFAPNGELVYDLQTNVEMYITRIAITLVVIGYSMWKLGEKQKK